MSADQSELESSLHLFQSPAYRGPDGPWSSRFADALGQTAGTLTWDVTTITSALGLGFAVGDRTLLREVHRRPWLSTGDRLETIPRHDVLAATPREAATQLLERLREEAVEVCADRSTIYVLLSGGLDSRIVAGVMTGLAREGRIAVPEAMTWGRETSRDVVYAKATAERLGLRWNHIDLGPESLERNLEAVATTLGGLVSPPHLHAMLWFENAPKDALVIASSWGDSVGRAEFSARHVLELKPLTPNNAFGLLRPEVLDEAAAGFRTELAALHARSPGVPAYVTCEHEQQGHYMRGMIGHAMSVINHHCPLYQMFTHPRVYGMMWSLHPAMRVDDIYAELLEMVDPVLARMPWARTNRALRGDTVGAQPGLDFDYHDYLGWTGGQLYEAFRERVDPDWFAGTGIFDRDAIAVLGEEVRAGRPTLPGSGRQPYDLWLWLASFRRFAEWVRDQGHDIVLNDSTPAGGAATVADSQNAGWLRHTLRQNRALTQFVRKMRRRVLRREALQRWPLRAGTLGD